MAEMGPLWVMKKWCSCLWPDLVESPAGWPPRSLMLTPARKQRGGYHDLLLQTICGCRSVGCVGTIHSPNIYGQCS